MILSINGAATDSMTIPEVLAQLVNVDEVCRYKIQTSFVISFFKVELEVQKVSGDESATIVQAVDDYITLNLPPKPKKN